MFFRARRALHRSWFNLQCRGLWRTRPLVCDDRSLTLVSMVCHGEALMYLLAVKSFCLGLGRVPETVVLNDGSLTDEDATLIRKHLPAVRFVSFDEVSTGSCPRGNCWERLLLICDLTQETYVLQVDCDTLTSGPIPEVDEAIREGRSFTLLGDRSFAAIEPMADAHLRLRDSTSTMVQAVCERAFDQLPERGELNYLRGNAGFTGFAKGSLNRERIEWFSERMRSLAGAGWDEWGSEQVASNLLIANTPGARPLPAPKYVSYWNHPDIAYERSSFLHFIGPFRYAKGIYRRLARRVIQKLQA